MTPPANGQQQPALGVNHEVTDHLSTRILVREARKVCDDLHLNIRGSRLRSLIRRYIEDGRTDVDFRTWFICYADPTGETAVRHVMRRGRA